MSTLSLRSAAVAVARAHAAVTTTTPERSTSRGRGSFLCLIPSIASESAGLRCLSKCLSKYLSRYLLRSRSLTPFTIIMRLSNTYLLHHRRRGKSLRRRTAPKSSTIVALGNTGSNPAKTTAIANTTKSHGVSTLITSTGRNRSDVSVVATTTDTERTANGLILRLNVLINVFLFLVFKVIRVGKGVVSGIWD